MANIRKPQTEMNNFKKQLDGLLATLQKLPVGEKQAALELLQQTLKDQVQSNSGFKSKDLSVPGKSSEKKGQQNLCDEFQVVHRECHTAEVDCGEMECAVQDKVQPEHISIQAASQVSQNFLQEKFSLDVLPKLSDCKGLGDTVVKVAVGDGNLLSHKELNTIKSEESHSVVTNPKEYSESQEYYQKQGTPHKTQIRERKSREIPSESVDNNFIFQEDNTSKSQATGNHGNTSLTGERAFIAHSILPVPANIVCAYEEQSHNLNKYEAVLEICSPEDKVMDPQHDPIPPLSHGSHQLALISAQDLSAQNLGAQDLSHGHHETPELTSLLQHQDQSKSVEPLEESGNSQHFEEHDTLLTDDTHLRIIEVKQGRSENRMNGSSKSIVFDESSSSSFNLATFHNIGDRESLYTVESQYLLPYLERECYEKADYKDNFSRKCHEQRMLFGDIDSDKNPVDLSSATSLHSSKADGNVLNENDSFHCYQKSGIRSPLAKGNSYVAESESSEPNTCTKKQRQSEVRRVTRKKIYTTKDRLPTGKTCENLTGERDMLITDKEHCEVMDHNALEENFAINKVTSNTELAQEVYDMALENEQAVPSTKFNSSIPGSIEVFDFAVNCNDNQREKERSCQNIPSDGTWCESELRKEESSCQNNRIEESECENENSRKKTQGQNEHLKGTGCENVELGKLHPVSCRTCKRQVADVSLFPVHQRQCCDPCLSCNYCQATFVNKVTYTRHVEGHKRNVCSKCSQSFCSHKKLKAHMKSEHNYNLISKLYPCSCCTRKFLKRSSLYHHLKVHASENEVVCQKCGLFCKDQESFELHMADHIKSAKFHCHICPAGFKRRQQYDDHLKHHKKNKCEMCGEPFHTKRALLRHCRSEHKMLPQNIALDPEYKCDKCNKVFNRPSHLLQHLQLHNGVKIECSMCDKQFSHKRGLRKHLNSVNHEQMLQTNDMEKDHAYDAKQKLDFTCEYCGIKLPSRHMLSKHSRSKHKVGITWSCPHCDYTTNRNHTLKRHMELHQESRNFMCEICGNSFQALATLKDHHRFVHSDERNYKCSECDKSFKNKSSLARHLRIHSDNRPYQCQCGTSYKRLSHLKRHMSSAHNEILKSRSVKKFKIPEGLDSGTDKSLSGENQLHNAECSDGEENDIAAVPNSSLSPVVSTEPPVKEPSDILLQGQESIILMGDNSNSGQSHIITVGDPQIIQFIPSTFFTQDNFQAVSLVSTNELHTLPMASSSSFAEGGSGSEVVVEPFSLSQNSEALVMVPTSQEDQDHIRPDVMRTTHRTLEEAGTLSLTSARIFREPLKPEAKQEMGLHSIQSHGELNVSTGLETYDYTAASSSSSPAFPALPPARYITHTHTHASTAPLTQDMLQPNLICSDFVLPVSGNR